MRLARAYALTGYDATYLEIAIRENLPLATLNRKLVEAAKGEGFDGASSQGDVKLIVACHALH
jgi:predicted nucleic acid-binding protein